MEHEKLKKIVGDNIAFFRKRSGLTQLQLAEKINYSDKAVSKWERGESLPDVFVLNDLADIFGISLNEFTLMPKARNKHIFYRNKVVISIAYTCIIWLVAVLAYVFAYFAFPEFDKLYLIFVLAITLSFILLLIFACVWRNMLYVFITYSCLVWSLLTTIFLFLPFLHSGIVYYVGIPLQLMGIFGFIVLRNKKGKKD